MARLYNFGLFFHRLPYRHHIPVVDQLDEVNAGGVM